MDSILIAEGNSSVAKLFATVLEQHDYAVTICRNGEIAAEALRGTERFDAMIVSYEVHGSNGVELIDMARTLNHRRTMPVVMVTGTSGIDSVAIAAGVTEILHKPVDIHLLVAVIKGMLREPDIGR